MKKIFSNINIPLLFFMIIYSAFGLLMIFSASSIAAVLRYQVPSSYFFYKQLIWLTLGYAGGLIVLKIPTKYYKFVSKLAMLGTLFLLVFLFFAGKVAGGAISWYDLGFFNFQPTELAKVVIIIYLSVYYHKLSFKKNITMMNMLYPLILVILIIILIAIQPDFGGAFILLTIATMMFLSLPIGKKHKKTIYKLAFVGLLILIIAVLSVGKNIFSSYQLNRILNYKNPCTRYSEHSGYQVCNGYIAIHNGGLFGVGLGKSTQKYLYLPEAHTDFIFPIICEELGLIIAILVIIGYFIILLIILSIAKKTDNLRNSLLAYGVFTYLLVHILINLLGVLGLIPLTGVPLPFLSYGGSYNLSVIISLFIVQRVNIENKLDKTRRQIENL